MQNWPIVHRSDLLVQELFLLLLFVYLVENHIFVELFLQQLLILPKHFLLESNQW